MEVKLVRVDDKISQRAESKKQFEKSVRPFIEKSLSAETRRAYGRVVREFFAFCKFVDPSDVLPVDVIRYRDSLIDKKRSAATVKTISRKYSSDISKKANDW